MDFGFKYVFLRAMFCLILLCTQLLIEILVPYYSYYTLYVPWELPSNLENSVSLYDAVYIWVKYSNEYVLWEIENVNSLF